MSKHFPFKRFGRVAAKDVSQRKENAAAAFVRNRPGAGAAYDAVQWYPRGAVRTVLLCGDRNGYSSTIVDKGDRKRRDDFFKRCRRNLPYGR